MKVLVDVNLSPRWSAVLAAAQFHVVHWSEIGPLDASDAEIMAFAARENYVVLTHNLDFGAALAVSRGRKPSVVQIRSENVSPDAIGTHVATALRQMARELAIGALLTIDPGRARLRLLPLGSDD